MFSNYHTHTYRCGHGKGDERAYIEAALKAGITTLGFSEHAPYTFGDTGYYSTYRMPEHDGPNYVERLLSLREEYADKIQILIGFEAEYYPLYFESFLKKIHPLPYDYLILGQHFIGNEIDSKYAGQLQDGIQRLTAYTDQCLAALKTGKFAYLAHPDLMRVDVTREEKKNELLRLCLGAKALGYPIEINLLGLREGRHYPSEVLYEAMAESGCDVVIGADAHTPDALLDFETYNRAHKIIQSYGLHHIDQIKIPVRTDL